MTAIVSVLQQLAYGLFDLVRLPLTIWQWWQVESLNDRMAALTLAGQSTRFLYLVLATILLVFLIGLVSKRFLRAVVLGLEGFNRRIGQAASWFVLLMMLQQVMIIVMGQVFRGNELLFSPFGIALSNGELQWLSGELKFYNAILIAFAASYTFIEGGHVRVDLVYGQLAQRTRYWVDFFGALLLMLPATILLWWFSWPIAANSVFSQKPMNIFTDSARWRGFKWESSGTAEFSWVWAFKVLILVFAALMFLQAVAFLLRNLWAIRERDVLLESHPKEDMDAIDELTPDIDLGGVDRAAAAGMPQHGRRQRG